MLKYTLDSLEGLEPAIAAMYEEKDGKFVLKVDGIPQPTPGEDVTGLKNKVDELLAEKKAEAKRRQEAEEAARLAAEEAARKTGDTDALQKSWEEKHTKALTEKEQTLSALQSQVHALTVGATAARLAGELAVQGSAGVLQRLIEPRLSMELRDGKPVVIVLDNDGRPTALTPEEFKNEITSDAALAPLVAGSKATGGGAAGSKGGGAAKKFNEYTGAELSAIRTSDPAKYDRLKNEFYGE